MRILCCVNRDIESNYALNLLLPELARAKHATRVVLSEHVGSATAPAAIRALRAVEQTIPNEMLFPLVERCMLPEGRALTFEELSRYVGGAPLTAVNLNAAAGLALLDSFAPEVILTIRYGHILRDRAIAHTKHGVINLHSGLLPQYRGILSTLYAMANGDADIGCTLHWIVDPGIDSGPIVAIARRPVEQGRSLFWHIMSLYPLGVPLILEAVRRLTSGEPVPRQPQQGGGDTYRSTPTAADVDALTSRGFELFDAADLRELFARFVPLAQRPATSAS
ncbi:MAG TPA: formyltransferase family protein [Gemmatimonadaceae bacterium]|nr:formyltransferase family protein [Gemmatimonadaceae bacterium]